jgi:hypothetical protein
MPRGNSSYLYGNKDCAQVRAKKGTVDRHIQTSTTGLWTGPTSLAYLFLWLSHTRLDLEIDGKLTINWSHAYLDCG